VQVRLTGNSPLLLLLLLLLTFSVAEHCSEISISGNTNKQNMVANCFGVINFCAPIVEKTEQTCNTQCFISWHNYYERSYGVLKESTEYQFKKYFMHNCRI